LLYTLSSQQPSWGKAKTIVSLDPWGADICEHFGDYLKTGYDIRPTIAVTKAHILLPEIKDAIKKGRIKVDGELVSPKHDVLVTKAAIEPVWYLPGVAKRFNISEPELRTILFQQTGGMFPELITRPDLKVLLPPIGGTTVYIFGSAQNIPSESHELTIRVHDE